MRPALTAVPLALALLLTGCSSDPRAEVRSDVQAVVAAANDRDADGLRGAVEALLSTLRSQVGSGELTPQEAAPIRAAAMEVLKDAALLEKKKEEAEEEDEEPSPAPVRTNRAPKPSPPPPPPPSPSPSPSPSPTEEPEPEPSPSTTTALVPPVIDPSPEAAAPAPAGDASPTAEASPAGA